MKSTIVATKTALIAARAALPLTRLLNEALAELAAFLTTRPTDTGQFRFTKLLRFPNFAG
jgi:hypothetical protein